MNTEVKSANEQMHVALIGVGVMGEALISALLASHHPRERILFLEKRDDRANEIASKFGVHRSQSWSEVAVADCIFLVTKPQDLNGVLETLKPHLSPTTLLVSFAAGKKTSFVEEVIGGNNPVIRVMPNTPLVVGEGISALSPGKFANQGAIEWLSSILSSSGRVLEVDESLQDAVTAMSGSGPAYFFRFVELMIESGMRLGLSQSDASTLTISTIKGAAAMLERSGKSATTLRENVTSPNGTTAAALSVFDSHHLDELIDKAIRAARDRSVELG